MAACVRTPEVRALANAVRVPDRSALSDITKSRMMSRLRAPGPSHVDSAGRNRLMRTPARRLFEVDKECNAVHKHQLDDMARSLKKLAQ